MLPGADPAGQNKNAPGASPYDPEALGAGVQLCPAWVMQYQIVVCEAGLWSDIALRKFACGVHADAVVVTVVDKS